MKKYILFLILIISSSKGDDNILLGKTGYASNNQEQLKNINDGDVKSCFSSGKLNANWVIMNFENVVQIKKVVVQTKINNESISVYIGNDFHLCKIHNQFKSYKFCKLINTKSIEFDCEKSGLTGQYLLFLKGNFSSYETFEGFQICEVEAYGKVMSKSNSKERPKISSELLTEISAKDFKKSKEIRRGIDKVIVPNYSQTFSYLGDCEPLIWDNVTLYAFSIVCQTKDGKGRLSAFGKNNYFKDIIEGNKCKELKNNIINWLSPNKMNASIIVENQIKSLSDLRDKIKKGDIIDFNVAVAYSEDVLKEMMLMVLNGTIAVNIDWTYFVGTSKSAQESYMKMFKIFNIDFNERFITWDSEREFILNDSDFTEDLLNVDKQINRMAKNHEYLLQKGLKIAEILSTFSNNIVFESTVKTDLEKLISKYDPLLSFICPCKSSPAIDPNDRRIIEILGKLFLNQAFINSNYKLPCIDLFPGDFETNPEKKIVSLAFTSQTDSTDNPTGYYLEAGSTLKYIVTKSSGAWSLRVGCHTDVLGATRPKWNRYPQVATERIKLNERGYIYSPFGGIILMFNDKSNQTLLITLFNIVQTPLFNLRSKSPALDWERTKNYPGLWGQVAGDNTVFCQESKKLKQYKGKYLEQLMKTHWDPLVKMDYSIKGLNWKEYRPEHIVLDIMTSSGDGHSGYPIVVWDDWAYLMFNESLIQKDGNWGMCHEIGHNMQDSSWTFESVVEVTNNLLCLFNYDKLWRLPRFGSNESLLRDAKSNIIKYLNEEINFDTWKSNPWIALSIYSQLASNLGWGFYKKVFEYYKTNKISPQNDDKKVSMWINITCQISKQNLLPLYEYWGIPFDESISKEMSKFPCFFPKDFFTRMNEERSNDIRKKYLNCASISKFFEDYNPENDIVGIRQNFIQELSSKTLSKEVLSSSDFEYLEEFTKISSN